MLVVKAVGRVDLEPLDHLDPQPPGPLLAVKPARPGPVVAVLVEDAVALHGVDALAGEARLVEDAGGVSL